MATQHPDSAEKYIAIQNEPEEAIHALTPYQDGGLGIEEIMVDFEGKLTPYHQPSQIALGLIREGLIPGKDVFITPRIPNADKETVFRQLMSMMSLVETNILAFKQTNEQAIRETVVPMIESGHELIQLQERINSVIELGNRNFDIQFALNSIRIIPLVESVPALVNIDVILEEYYQDSISKGSAIENIRIMLGRSDSAMSYGMLSSVLAVLIAIDKSLKWGNLHGVQVAPILGCGALPFRGHLTRENLDNLLQNYAGIRTCTIQSGLRYDHGEAKTIDVVKRIKQNTQGLYARTFTPEDIELMKAFIAMSTKHYMQTFLKTIVTVEHISRYMPKNRDRLSTSKTGLEYIREIARMKEISALVSDKKLTDELLGMNTDIQCAVPRAIAFTAALYTVGLPPEFIGIGRCLKDIVAKYGDEGVQKLLKFYPQLKHDLVFASKYVNIKIAEGIIDESARLEYQEDYDLACGMLKVCDKDKVNEDDFYHTLLESTRPILLHLIGNQKEWSNGREEKEKMLKERIVKMGKIRGSLG